MTLEEIKEITKNMKNCAAIEGKDGQGFSFSMTDRTIRIFEGAGNPEDKKFIDLTFDDLSWLERMIYQIKNNNHYHKTL